jgi:hypothetical protein
MLVALVADGLKIMITTTTILILNNWNRLKMKLNMKNIESLNLKYKKINDNNNDNNDDEKDND